MGDGYSTLSLRLKRARVMAGVWLLVLAGGVFGVGAQAAPSITSISPESGTNYHRVTITGTGFGSSQGTSTVTFGGTAAARVYEWSDTEIEARPPTSLTVGAHAVVVTVGGVGSNGVDYTRLPQLTAYCLSPSQTIAEPSGTFQMGVYRTGPTTDAVTVTVTYGGTATHGVDYTAPTTLTIAAGDRREEATLEVLDDSLAEGDERINYAVSAEGYIGNNCQLTLEDDNDTGSATSPTISGLNPDTGAEGTSVEIAGLNFGASRGTSTVSFNQTAVGTYTSWSASSIVVEVPAGATTGEVVVTVGSEASNGVSFTVTASPVITSLNPDTGAVETSVEITGSNFGASRGTSTVSFNGTAVAAYTSWSDSSIVVEAPAGATTGDVVVTVGSEVSAGVSFTVTAASPGVSVDPARLTVPEGGMGTYTVVLDTRPTADVTITVAVPQGASITAAPSPLIFTSLNWDSPQTVTVTEPEDDDALDETYSMIHRVTSTDFDYSNPFVQWSVIEVIDNDAATAGVTLDPEELTVPEGGSASYTVVLDTQPTASVRVSILISLQAEFSVAPSPLTFTTTNWNKPRTVTVTEPEDDNALDETHFVTHSVTSSDSDYAGLFVDRMAVRIIDNDAPRGPGVRIEPARLRVSEGGTGSYTVVLDTQPSAAVTVTVAAPAGLTLISPADGSLDFTPSNWPTAQTVRFTADEDPDIDDEVFTIAHHLTSADTDYTGAAAGVRVTVTDDDETLGPGLMVLPARLRVPEGGAGSYTVALNTQPTAAVTVAVAPGAGLRVDRASLSFTAGQSGNWAHKQMVTVTAGEDADTVDETVGITHSVASSDSDYSGTAEGVAVRIADNDVLGVLVSPRFLRIDEGQTGTYEVWLRMAPPSAVTVAVTPGAGLTVDQASLSFTAGQSGNWAHKQSVTVTAGEDPDTVDETASITHSVSLAPDASSPSEYIYLGNRLVAIEPGWSGTGLAMSDQVQVEIIDDDGVTVTPLCPDIVRLNPTAAPVGTEVTITGLNFGANRDSSTVTFDGTAVTTYISWSDTEIVVEVPSGATTGDVEVTVDGNPGCNAVNYTVAPTAIWAVPNPCVIDRADDVDCGVTIRWASIPPVTAVQVWVSHNGDPQRPFTGTGTTSGSRPATWIQAAPHTYTVNLYDLSGGNPDPATPPPGAPLATVEVRAGSDGMIRSYIWADPQTCTIGQGDDDCTTEIVWTSRNTSAVRVWVSHNGSTTAFTDMDSLWGIKDATFIGDSSSYTFSVHDHSGGSKGAQLASVVVRGTRTVTPPDPKGTLTPSTGSCTIATGANDCSFTLNWTRMHATRIQVRKGSTVLEDSTQSSGSVAVDVSLGSNTFELWDYSGGTLGGGLATAAVTGTRAVTPAPVITNLNPDSGDVGTVVTITGSNFGSSRGSSRVTFNGTTASTSSWSATSIRATVPSGATTGPVVVTVNSIGSNTDKIFTMNPKGTLTVRQSTCTIAAGQTTCQVTLDWTRMHATRIQVRKGSTVLEDSTQPSGSVAVDVSLGSNTFELWDYSGCTLGGGLATAAVTGTRAVTPAPVITNLNPDSGDVGTVVTIAGSNFGSSRGSSRVTFNGTTASTSSWSATSIRATVPSGATTGPVVVTVNSIGSNTDKIFTMNPKGTLTARQSTCTIAAGQTTCQVTLDWTRMHATRIQVRKGSTVLEDSTQPSGSVAVDVSLGSNTFELWDYSGGTLGGGLATAAVTGTRAVTPAPVITNLNPDSGDVGTVVTIAGSNFGSSRGSSRVTFNGTTASTSSWSATSIRATVPSGATTGPVVVTVNSIGSNTDKIFTMNPKGTLTARQSTCTIAAGQTTCQVTLDWTRMHATRIQVRKQGSSTALKDSTQPSGYVPVDMSAGSNTFELYDYSGGTLGDRLAWVTVNGTSGPVITDLDPDSGDVGTEVTITGRNFGSSRGASRATFNGTAVVTYDSWSDTSIEVEVPTGAATGNVVVTVSGKPASNGVNFMVNHDLPTCTISATRPHIQTGGTSRLEWSSTDATSAELDPGGAADPNGFRDVRLNSAGEQKYELTVTGPGGSAICSVTVKAWEAPEAEIDTDDPHIRPGGSSRLEWDSDNASSVTVTDIDTVTSNEAGSGTVRPSATKEYEIRATNPAVPAYTAATDSVTVTVWSAPEAEIDANPKTIDSGDSTRLEWDSDNASSVTVTDIGTVTPNEAGSQLVTPSDTKTYRIRATNPAVPAYTAATDSVTVTVRHEGSISANPNPCTFPSNGNSCGTTLSWSSTGSVEVRDNYGDAIVTNGNPSGTHPVTGITETRVTYSLYKFSNARDLPFLDSVEVYGVPPPPSGWISASPNPCEIDSGQNTCTTTITWGSSNTTAVQVWVSHRQGSTTTTGAFTGLGTTSGSQSASWIQVAPAHGYVFSLYDLSNGNPDPTTPPAGSPLDTVSVTGEPAPPPPPPPPTPVISDISPSQGETDTRVTILGANFGTSQGTVSFGGSSASIQSWTSGTIVALVPLYLPTGTVGVTVTVPGNPTPSNTVNFTVTGNPFNRDPEEDEDEATPPAP